MNNTASSRSTRFGTLIASLIATVSAILLIATLAPSASAETPAQRCKRETAAYNAAWAAIGKKPPAPYKCGGSNAAPPTLSPSSPETDSPEKSTTPEAPDESSTDDSGPDLNSPTERRELEHPGRNQPTIKPGTDTLQQSLERARMLVDQILRAVNPRAKYLSYSKADRKLADNYVTPVGGKPRIDIKDLGRRNVMDYCRSVGLTLERPSLAGNVLYTWWQEVQICGNPGVRMSSIKILQRGGETKTPTWSYTGIAFDPVARVGVDRYHGYTLTGEKFKQEIVWSGIGAGERTECFSGTATIAGDFDANDSCRIAG